jgi:hypothetical protein
MFYLLLVGADALTKQSQALVKKRSRFPSSIARRRVITCIVHKIAAHPRKPNHVRSSILTKHSWTLHGVLCCHAGLNCKAWNSLVNTEIAGKHRLTKARRLSVPMLFNTAPDVGSDIYNILADRVTIESLAVIAVKTGAYKGPILPVPLKPP